MTIRQRQAPGSATAPVANGADSGSDRSAPFSWEDWFQHANAHQRAEALGLARQQGLLYPNQLPALSNGVKPAAVKEIEASPFLARLLAGKTESLPPPQLETLTFFDAELDDLQRQAVARAMGTPDLFMLQGLPGTGKSRVLTEVLLQAAARGWRVLFLAGNPASVDVVLNRLIGRPDVFALRFLDALEKPEGLPAWLRGFTVAEQQQAFLERALAGARGNHAEAESACRKRRADAPLWPDLHACVERCRDIEERLHALQKQLPRLGADLEREAEMAHAESPLMARLAELRQERDEATREIDAAGKAQQDALAKAEQEAAPLAARIAEREPAYRAKKKGQFWTLSYWKNLFNAAIIPEVDALLEQQAKAIANTQAIDRQIDQLTEQSKRRHEQFNQERTALLENELQARHQAVLLQQQTLGAEARKLEDEWTELCRRLDVSPATKTPEAIAGAQRAWLQRKQGDEQQCQFAQEWTNFVEASGPQLAVQLPSFANVLAGTIQRWQSDAKLRDAGAGPFDLLMVEDAETLTEADFLKLARQARRTVLVAQSLTELTPAPTIEEKASRALLPPLVSAACWNRLWQVLGGDAGCWPCAWHREQDRLVCQLMPLTAEDRQHLESEGLADAPDIDLCILHRPRTRPCLAQMMFGPDCSFADAFTFMVREVQEFPLEPLGRTSWWSEDVQRLTRHLGPNAVRMHAWLEIEAGLRLGMVADERGDATRVVRIEFDKGASWDRVKAEAWLHRHRPVCDHERTAFLQTPYRFERPLAKIVQAVVRAGEWLPSSAEWSTRSASAVVGLAERVLHIRGVPSGDGPFEFIAVPPLAKPKWPREGAGLELDLSASRHADRLPVGLRQGLPPRGFVNYLEAQALIRRLEAWLRKETIGASCRVAVLALYEGQVELLRRLVEQSEILRARAFPLEVALPSKLHQRECDVVFLSLTRSHAHRCVTFGEDVKELPLALTRGRSRLVVFGDAGSLCKRATWHGPLDHLDASSAHQEQLRLSRLLAYLQKQGHPLPAANGSLPGKG